ncbi:hypothetical protein BDR26DRAFT_872494 [Obelidium mucronatum]|nr:hypothetical protein BDR26DRAFT_872494 [Obelidium mucronatum]
MLSLAGTVAFLAALIIGSVLTLGYCYRKNRQTQTLEVSSKLNHFNPPVYRLRTLKKESRESVVQFSTTVRILYDETLESRNGQVQDSI